MCRCDKEQNKANNMENETNEVRGKSLGEVKQWLRGDEFDPVSDESLRKEREAKDREVVERSRKMEQLAGLEDDRIMNNRAMQMISRDILGERDCRKIVIGEIADKFASLGDVVSSHDELWYSFDDRVEGKRTLLGEVVRDK